MNPDETIAAIMAKVERLSATLAEQQAIISRQEAAISQQRDIIVQQQADIEALQQTTHAAPSERLRPTLRLTADADERAEHAAHAEAEAPHTSASAQTSRRSLLKGAAVATAAATVATVATGAVSAPQIAHAASGSALVLGQANDANATTALANTAGSAPNPVLTVTNNDTTTSTGSSVLSVTNNNTTNSSPNTSNDGIVAKTSGGAAIYGFDSSTGIGVEGAGAAGVYGSSNTGWGVIGATGTGIDLAASGTGRIWQAMQAQVGVPSGQFKAGESIRDANGDLWLCVSGNGSTPGNWVKVAHLAPGFSSGGATTYLSNPIRLLDTRPGAAALFHPGAPYAGGSTHALQIAGDTYNSVTVPAVLAGAIGNLTVVNPTGGGYVALVPHGAGFSGTANLAYSAGQVLSNAFNVGLASGQVDIIIGGSASTDVIIDLFAVVA